jgi:DNA polymerase V
MSNRVMSCIEEMVPRLEVYSVDEGFCDCRAMELTMPYENFGRMIREHVLQCTGLTVGCGLAPTKTLAKSAQWASKEWPQFRGVLALTSDNPGRIEQMLSRQPVEELWGVGSRIGKRLNLLGINTALELARTSPVFILKNFSVVLERTVRELNGESCIEMEDAPPPKQQIVVSRSFGERITTYEAMRQAICTYAERVGEKLREDRQYCHHVSVFIRTSPFDNGRPGYSNTAFVRLQVGTQDTRDIIQAAMRSLDSIWQPGFRFAKAGIMLSELRPDGFAQLNLFDEQAPRAGSDALMSLMDKMNRSGRYSIGFAGKGIQPEWRMKREMLSKAWTTNWKDIPLARIC